MTKCTPEAQQYVKSLLTQPENSICADCLRNASKWASSTLGVFICYECSGIHRSLGTHISFVRSCVLDGWTPDQAKLMKRVGNKNANDYWEGNLPKDYPRPSPFDRYGMEIFIRAKYAEGRWALSGEPPHLKKAKMAYSRSSPHTSSVPISNSKSNDDVHIKPTQEESPSAFDFISSSSSNDENGPKTEAPLPVQAEKCVIAKKPIFVKKTPAQQAEPISTESNFDFINQMASQRTPKVVQGNIPKPKGVARFMKKPTGDQVIDQMISLSGGNKDFRPVSAPVQQRSGKTVSIFDGLDFSSTKK